MSRTIEYWCDSGANIHSRRKGTITTEELGYSEEEWDMMEEDEREDIVKDIAFARLDWGFREI